MITKKELIEMRELADRATQGPWTPGVWTGICYKEHSHGVGNCEYKRELNKKRTCCISKLDEPIDIVTTTTEYGAMKENDAAFIANARTTIPRLLDELARLKELLGDAKDILEREVNYKFGQYCDSERIKEFLNRLKESDKE